MLDELTNIAVENAAELAEGDQDAFRKIRQDGLGASDSSIVLGVNPFQNSTEVELINQKIKEEPTAEEKKIGDMVNVRKGRDLEPIILDKFCKKFNVEVDKPPHMYELKELKFLRVNFDGLLEQDGQPEIPVEVKFISKYGAKYYDFTKCIDTLEESPPQPASSEVTTPQYIKDMAGQTGIPVYYYTQIQQQLLCTGAEYAYLTGLWDDKWKLYTWKVYRDERTIDQLKLKGFKVWQKVERLKT